MIVATSLSGFREDSIGILSKVVGTTKADAFVTGLETHIQQQAKIGASRAVKPWLIGALAVSTVALLVGGVALFRRR